MVIQFVNEPNAALSRRLFEKALLEQGFLLEKEIDPIGNGFSVLKLLCPVEKLILEAETIQLGMTLQSDRFALLKKTLLVSQNSPWGASLWNHWNSEYKPEILQLTGRFTRSRIRDFAIYFDDQNELAGLFTNSQKNLLVF